MHSDFLATACQALDYRSGRLLSPSSPPSAVDSSWLEAGDWLTLARRISADYIYFVGNDPTLVFRSLPVGCTERDFIQAYRDAWCMAGPRCLFVASSQELRVYPLNRPPARAEAEWRDIEPLATIRDIGRVAADLSEFHRENVDSGSLFSEAPFSDSTGRATESLIRDLRSVRRLLLASGLSPSATHSLITRVVFVRYLEDRAVLTESYFRSVAASHRHWTALLDDQPTHVAEYGSESWVLQVLRDLDFTWALFDQLEQDFNGDTFAKDEFDRSEVSSAQLDLLRRLLIGQAGADQPRLFFWAYDFRVIPIGLISSIYEDFYHTADVADGAGTHYTSIELVDDLLSTILTPERLSTEPRVIDPACGSGIFLVQAFNRIVRFESMRRGRALSSAELREVLVQRIAGIESNAAAVRVAAFSLCLALLNWQDPPQIRASSRLPKLISVMGEPAVLCNADAFAPTRDELNVNRAEKGAEYRNQRVQKWLRATPILCFTANSFDVVVGNPPWNEAESASFARQWAAAFRLPVGESSYSQLFIHRALVFAKDGGAVGLLVHASVIFNSRQTSVLFRQYWLSQVTLNVVVNYSHLRRVAFNQALAPFLFVYFESRKTDAAVFEYTSARLTAAATNTKSLRFAAYDRTTVRQADVLQRDYLWKTYWWGNHLDAALMSRLDYESTIRELVKDADVQPGYGFQRGRSKPSVALRQSRPLSSRHMESFGPLREEWHEDPPAGVKRQPDERLYAGQRLLVTRGVKNGHGPVIRLETQHLTFRHTIYAVPLATLPRWKARIVLGILWSSLGRYRMFMSSGAWGAWYDSVVPEDLLSVPVRFGDKNAAHVREIQASVEALQMLMPPTPASLFSDDSHGERQSCFDLLARLDDAVFELFGLTDAERMLISDRCNYVFDYLQHGSRSPAAMPVGLPGRVVSGTERDINRLGLPRDIQRYLQVFLGRWNRELAEVGELHWKLIESDRAPLIAATFAFAGRGSSAEPSKLSRQEWQNAVTLCDPLFRSHTHSPFGYSVVRAISDQFVIVIRRNERRLWTGSTAHEDADASFVQAMNLRRDT